MSVCCQILEKSNNNIYLTNQNFFLYNAESRPKGMRWPYFLFALLSGGLITKTLCASITGRLYVLEVSSTSMQQQFSVNLFKLCRKIQSIIIAEFDLKQTGQAPICSNEIKLTTSLNNISKNAAVGLLPLSVRRKCGFLQTL